MRREVKLILVMLIFFCLGCSSNRYEPKPVHQISSNYSNYQIKTIDDITITVAVLNDQESEVIFDVPAVSRGVEPVWVQIQNNDSIPYVLFPIRIDPNYFSPHEAARKVRYPQDSSTTPELMEYFDRHDLKKLINPGETVSGFIYTIPDTGVKEFEVKLVGPNTTKRSYFVFPVPGIKVDFEDLDYEEIYSTHGTEEVDDISLRNALVNLPCCTTNEEESGDGDPINLIVIGEIDEFLPYFLRQGWEVTEDIYVSSLIREVGAFFLGSSYRYAPVSSLYVFKRGQDIALQKPRENIFRRNHLRLWLSHIRYDDKPVWVGQISRDIGVSFSTKNWWLSNHEIDPDVDEARDFLAQDLILSHGVKKFGYVRGMDPSPKDKPMMNFMDQPIYTDGLRAVFVFTDEHIDIVDLELFHWEWPFEYKNLHKTFSEENIHKTQTE